jgi:myo-inositol-1(or 4)-monophosphatase
VSSAPGPWLDLGRRAVEEVRRVLADLPTRTEREPVIGAGVGGDQTTAIDAAAEGAIVRLLEGVHADGHDFLLVSEELGERTFGEGDRTRVVVDPIDGSMNAKRGIPYFSLSIAVADGDRMGDVFFGYVYDFGTGEEWRATRGVGAWLNGDRLGAVRPKEQIELLSVEATVSRSVADKALAFAGFARRLRIMGSLALSLCHLCAGRVDAVCSLKEARAVDVAAAQLLLRECWLPIVYADGSPFDAAPLDTAPHSPVAAAGSQELCERLAHIVAP